MFRGPASAHIWQRTHQRARFAPVSNFVTAPTLKRSQWATSSQIVGINCGPLIRCCQNTPTTMVTEQGNHRQMEPEEALTKKQPSPHPAEPALAPEETGPDRDPPLSRRSPTFANPISSRSQTMSPNPSLSGLRRTASGMLIPVEGKSPGSLCRTHSQNSGLNHKRKLEHRSPPRAAPRGFMKKGGLKGGLSLNIEIPSNLMLSPSVSFRSLSPTRFSRHEQEQQVAREWVRRLGDIQLLAVDFDATCVDVETKGQWTRSAEQLAARFRPLLRAAIEEAFALDLKVAIVSFSPQHALISEVLKLVVPGCADQIILRTGPPKTVSLATGASVTIVRNKQRHIASVLEEMAGGGGIATALEQVMLIDDDFRNVDDARASGCQAVWFNPEETLSFACDQCQLMQSNLCDPESKDPVHTKLHTHDSMLEGVVPKPITAVLVNE